MKKLTLASALSTLPILALVGCSTTQPEPTPAPTPAATNAVTPGPQAGFPGGLRAIQLSKGDFLAAAVKAPAKLVKGVYGSGAVHQWHAIPAADQAKGITRYEPHLSASRMFYAEPTTDGSKMELAIPIDAAQKTQIFVIPTASPAVLKTLKMPSLALDLKLPNGALVKQTDNDVHINDYEGEDEVVALLPSKFQHIKLDRPSLGMHKLLFTKTAAVPEVGAIVLQPAGVALEVTTDRETVLTGEPIVIHAHATPAAGQTIVAAGMVAKIFDKAHTIVGTVTLKEDLGADHRFTGTFTPSTDDLSQVGTWSVMVEGRGTTGEGAPFVRHVSTGFGVSVPFARFTGAIDERNGETNGVATHQFMVHVETAVASRYRVKAIVLSNGVPVAETITSLELPLGSSRVDLAIPFKLLEGQTGALALGDLQLVSFDTEFPIARIADAYVGKVAAPKR